MSANKNYPWVKVVVGYSIVCPAVAGFFYLFLIITIAQAGFPWGIFEARLPTEELSLRAYGVLIITPLFSIGGVIAFGIPFLVFSLFIVGFKVRKGVQAYLFAVGWGAFLGLFLIVLTPSGWVNADVYFSLQASISLGLAALLVTYWVVPSKGITTVMSSNTKRS